MWGSGAISAGQRVGSSGKCKGGREERDFLRISVEQGGEVFCRRVLFSAVGQGGGGEEASGEGAPGEAKGVHAPRRRRPQRQPGRSPERKGRVVVAGDGGARIRVRDAPFSSAAAAAREGEVDMEEGEGGGNESGGSTVGEEQAGLHPAPGAGAAANQEVPMGSTAPP